MSKNRNKEADKEATRRLILDPNRPKYRGGANWLGHGVGRSDGHARVDELLLDGATMERLEQERGGIWSHFTSLKRDHDLLVTCDANGVYRFDRQHLGITLTPLVPAAVVPVMPLPPTTLGATADVSAAEGREFLRLHRLRERNRRLVARKKRDVLSDSGRLACEACGFDFAAAYGPRGDGFAECHHTLPISQLVPGRRTRLSELAVVCANCHRMLHRRLWVSIAELRQLVDSRRGG